MSHATKSIFKCLPTVNNPRKGLCDAPTINGWRVNAKWRVTCVKPVKCTAGQATPDSAAMGRLTTASGRTGR